MFSRQRYWGEPIPLIHCKKCGTVPVPESELPVELPNVESYQPTDTGESPLSAISEWVNTTCPVCGGPAERETNTMPQWAGSSWYYLRYCDVNNDKELANKDALKKWLPVDMYVGGIEHAVLHLLYARFYTKFLYDIGAVDFEEPFLRLFNQGMITKNGAKMSKSKEMLYLLMILLRNTAAILLECMNFLSVLLRLILNGTTAVLTAFLDILTKHGNLLTNIKIKLFSL